jgi:hypothetical protein
MSSIFSIERTEHKFADIEHMDGPSGNVTGYGKSQFYQANHRTRWATASSPQTEEL